MCLMHDDTQGNGTEKKKNYLIVCVFVSMCQELAFSEIVCGITGIKGGDTHRHWASDCRDYRSH